MKFLLTSMTFWVLLVFGILVGLQWFPMTGVFLMMFAAPIWVGYMPHAVALALFFDLVIKRAPKVLLLVPVLPYVIYYGYFMIESVNIKNIEADLKKRNPSKIIAYDPEMHSLVLDSSMTKYYAIPVSYSYSDNFPEGFLSHRLATRDLCNKAKGIKEFTHTFGVIWSSYGEKRYHKSFRNICHFRMPEKPTREILKVERHDDDDKRRKLRKTVYRFFLDERYLGEYTNAYYVSLRSFPQFIIGCTLISSSPEWKCVSQLLREKRYFDTFPANGDKADQDGWVVARLLNIKKYTEQDLENFRDYPETKEVLGALIEQKEKETPEDLDECGLRKDSLYQPKIGEKNGCPSFEGVIYEKYKGCPFYVFIKKYEGKTVYLDIEAKTNARDSLANYGVCKKGEKFNHRTDNVYYFRNEYGSRHYFEEEGKFKGFFAVGPETPFESMYRKGDNDTRTVLTFLPQEKLK